MKPDPSLGESAHPFCETCKFYRHHAFDRMVTDRCHHPSLGRLSHPRNGIAITTRRSDDRDGCSPTGNQYEPRT